MRGTSSRASPLPAQFSRVQSRSRAPLPEDAVCSTTETIPTLAQTITANPLSISHSRLTQSLFQTYPLTRLLGAYTALPAPDVLLTLPASAPDSLPESRPLGGSSAPAFRLRPVLIGPWPHLYLPIGLTCVNSGRLLHSHSPMPLSIKTLAANRRRSKRSPPLPPQLGRTAV